MKRKLFTFMLLSTVLFSCTENSRARNWGGTEHLDLNSNEVLINMTWKENNLWVLTQDTITGTKYFREHSSWGVVEGEIIIK
jgi:hypothetical protein